ncbi:MAG: tyrosine-type recombinase/integrase [Pseudonocardiaceae bacterium]
MSASSTKRRGRGEDSIYWDEANQCWIGAVSLGHGADGRRLRATVRGKTKTEVRDKLKRLHKEIEAGVKSSASYAVGDAVRTWLDSAEVKKKAPKTREKFRTLAENHLIPQIGKAILRDLRAHHVEDWLEGRAEVLTTSTLRELLPILRRAIKLAQRDDLVSKNVAEFVTLPSGQPGRKRRSLTVEQAVSLLAAAMSHRLSAYVIVSLTTGIRTEEARELKWERVHLGCCGDTPPHIEVWRSVRVGNDTKTEKSRRTLELPHEAVAALKEQAERQETARQMAGGEWEHTGYVFTSAIGTRLDASNVRRGFRQALLAAGIVGKVGEALRTLREPTGLRLVDVATELGWPRSKIGGIENGRLHIKKSDLDRLIELYRASERDAAVLSAIWVDDSWTPQELRHSFISLLSDAGVRIEDISKLAGHANTRVTETVYRHELRPVLTRGATAMSQILASPSGSCFGS